MNDQLCLAVYEGNLSLVKRLLSESTKTDSQSRSNKQTPLHLAVHLGYLEIAALLIGNGANLEAIDIYAQTPLHLASYWGHSEIAALLIDHDAKLEARNINKDTPLHLASRMRRLAMVVLLIGKGANLEAIDSYKETPLHIVSYPGNSEIANLLIDRDAKLAPINIHNKTPLDLAIHNPHNLIAQLLLQKGAYSYPFKHHECFNDCWKKLEHSPQPDLPLYTKLILAGASILENQVIPDSLDLKKQAIEATITAWLEPLSLSTRDCQETIPLVLKALPRLLNWVKKFKDVKEVNSSKKEPQQTLREVLLIFEGDGKGLNEKAQKRREAILEYLETLALPNDILLTIRDITIQKALVATLKQCYPIFHRVADYLVAEVIADTEVCAAFHNQLFEHNWPEPCSTPVTKSMQDEANETTFQVLNSKNVPAELQNLIQAYFTQRIIRATLVDTLKRIYPFEHSLKSNRPFLKLLINYFVTDVINNKDTYISFHQHLFQHDWQQMPCASLVNKS